MLLKKILKFAPPLFREDGTINFLLYLNEYSFIVAYLRSACDRQIADLSDQIFCRALQGVKEPL